MLVCLLACLLFIPSLQALGYLPPQLPSPISFGNKEKMYVTAKVYDNSSKFDSHSMLHGGVMVFRGDLSDNSPAIAKLPATDALLDLEVRVNHVSLVANLLGCCCALLHRRNQVQGDCVQENNLHKISKWPELTGSVVVLRGIGHTEFCSRPVLILQPVGRLIPCCIQHDALLALIKQFACIVEQLSVRGYLHGDLSYNNLLQHQASEDEHKDDHGMRALLVDMQTLMPLQQVPCSLMHVLRQKFQYLYCQLFTHRVSVCCAGC